MTRQLLGLALGAACAASISAQSTAGDTSAETTVVSPDGSQTASVIEHFDEIRDAMANVTAELSDIGHEHALQLQKLGKQREKLRTNITASYSVARQGPLKLVLNQNSLTDIGRVLALHAYLKKTHLDQIKTGTKTLDTISTLRHELIAKRSQLTELQQLGDDARQALDRASTERGELLTTLDNDIFDSTVSVENLKVDENRLGSLLGDLQNQLPVVPDSEVDLTPFAQRRGNLPWPIDGIITNRFGERNESNNQTWHGVNIATTEFTEVLAVAPGRVAFADWLRGLGMFVIIDHGDGYMSLYGRNMSLAKELGDWVAAGEVIAEISPTISPEPGLYFEIRHNGAPVNPIKWCSSAPNGSTSTLVSR